MIPMGSESCEWPFVGQNKNFVKLDEKTLIHVDRQPSLKPAMNATTKLSEYGNLPNGKYRVVARAQI